MSLLRKQVEQARAEYRQLRYPGDLAADVLAPIPAPSSAPTGIRRWFWTVAALTAAAATLMLVIYLTDPSTAPLKIANNVVTDPIDPGDDDEDRIEVSWSDVPAPSLSELPGGLSLWPPALTLSFAPPTISFLNDTTETEQTEPSTTQEAV